MLSHLRQRARPTGPIAINPLIPVSNPGGPLKTIHRPAADYYPLIGQKLLCSTFDVDNEARKEPSLWDSWDVSLAETPELQEEVWIVEVLSIARDVERDNKRE
jgi:hypothetical protein